MTRTEADIAAIIASVADDLVVDTDAFVSTVKQRHRKRRRMQLAVAGGVTAVVALGVSVPDALLGPLGSNGLVPVAPTGPAAGWTGSWAFAGSCPAEKIPDPLDVEPGLPIWLTAMDSTGRYVVGTYGPRPAPDGIITSANGQPVRWDNGVGHVLPVAGENVKFVQVSSVNRHGWVVGASYADFGEPAVAWISRDATSWEVLPPPAGYRAAYAAAVNDRGDVVGMAFGADGIHPVVWSPDGAGGWTSRVIDAMTSNNTLAIDDDGVVTVFVTGRQPHRWHPDGRVSGPPPLDHLAWVEPIQVRGDWVVASGGRPSEGNLAQTEMVLLRWNIRTGETSVVQTRAASMWSGATVNARGDVAWAGTLRTHDGREYALPNPPDVPRVDAPVAISEDATLIASPSGYVWRC